MIIIKELMTTRRHLSSIVVHIIKIDTHLNNRAKRLLVLRVAELTSQIESCNRYICCHVVASTIYIYKFKQSHISVAHLNINPIREVLGKKKLIMLEK